MKSKIISVFLLSVLISISTVFAFTPQKPTLIIFYAEWCKYCKVAQKDIANDQELSQLAKNYDIVLANFDVDKDLVEGYNIKTIPTFVILNSGKVLQKVGYNGSQDLIEFLK